MEDGHPERLPVRTRWLRRRQDYDELFGGFEELRAVVYVVSLRRLLDLFETFGYRRVEVVVGLGLCGPESLKRELQALGQDAPDLPDRVLVRAESGDLRILFKKDPLPEHTKLYILKGGGRYRMVNGSPNLTDTAWEGRQSNYVWVVDAPPGDGFVEQVMRDYERAAREARPFMGDLVELLRRGEVVDRREALRLWLFGSVGAGDDGFDEVRDFVDGALTLLPERPRETVVMTLPPDRARAERVRRFLGIPASKAGDGRIVMTAEDVAGLVHKKLGFPMMWVAGDGNEKELRAFLPDVGLLRMAEPPPRDPAVVAEALGHVEAYIDTVRLGQPSNPDYALAAHAEALLYIFYAPFAGMYAAAKRAAYGSVDTRGPRFLYIYGRASNGKSTFLRWSLRLLTGMDVRPLAATDFSAGPIRWALTCGTMFPLVFDDVRPSGKKWFESLIKSYWDAADPRTPLLVVASNEERLQDWAASRAKRIHFDVHFTDHPEGKARLKELFDRPNDLFRWFAWLYLRRWEERTGIEDDEPFVARAVFRELYEHARRPRPSYFLDHPLEDAYDPGREEWRETLYSVRSEARLDRQGRRTLVRLPDHWSGVEVRNFVARLPQKVKYKVKGRVVIIESPEAFEDWLGPPPRRFLWRLFRRR